MWETGSAVGKFHELMIVSERSHHNRIVVVDVPILFIVRTMDGLDDRLHAFIS